MDGRELRHNVAVGAATAVALAGSYVLGIASKLDSESAHRPQAITTSYFPEGNALPGQDVEVHESMDSIAEQVHETLLPASAGEYNALQQSSDFTFPGYIRGPSLSFFDLELQPGLTPAQVEAGYKEAVSAVGIEEVQFEPGASLPPADVQLETGPYEQAFYELASVPQSVIAASGIRKIVLAPQNKKDFWYFTEPKHHGDTLVLPDNPDGLNLTDGLGAMILDHYFNAKDRHKILHGLDAITHEAGKQYDPHYYYQYALPDAPGTGNQPVTQEVATGNTLSGIALAHHISLAREEALNRDIRDPNLIYPGEIVRVGLGISASTEETQDYTARFGDKVFYDADSVRSPRNEFIQLFSDAITGTNHYSTKDLSTPIGKKRQLVQAVFDSIEPHGQNWEVFGDVRGWYGSCGQNQYDIADRIQGIVDGTLVLGQDWCANHLSDLNSHNAQY